MMTAQHTPSRIEVYWDESDSAMPGWAYRLTYGADHQESGAAEDFGGVDPDEQGLAGAVAAIAHLCGVSIDRDSVAVDDAEGGSAIWHDPETL